MSNPNDITIAACYGTDQVGSVQVRGWDTVNYRPVFHDPSNGEDDDPIPSEDETQTARRMIIASKAMYDALSRLGPVDESRRPWESDEQYLSRIKLKETQNNIQQWIEHGGNVPECIEKTLGE